MRFANFVDTLFLSIFPTIFINFLHNFYQFFQNFCNNSPVNPTHFFHRENSKKIDQRKRVFRNSIFSDLSPLIHNEILQSCTAMHHGQKWVKLFVSFMGHIKHKIQFISFYCCSCLFLWYASHITSYSGSFTIIKHKVVSLQPSDCFRL